MRLEHESENWEDDGGGYRLTLFDDSVVANILFEQLLAPEEMAELGMDRDFFGTYWDEEEQRMHEVVVSEGMDEIFDELESTGTTRYPHRVRLDEDGTEITMVIVPDMAGRPGRILEVVLHENDGDGDEGSLFYVEMIAMNERFYLGSENGYCLEVSLIEGDESGGLEVVGEYLFSQRFADYCEEEALQKFSLMAFESREIVDEDGVIYPYNFAWVSRSWKDGNQDGQEINEYLSFEDIEVWVESRHFIRGLVVNDKVVGEYQLEFLEQEGQFIVSFISETGKDSTLIKHDLLWLREDEEKEVGQDMKDERMVPIDDFIPYDGFERFGLPRGTETDLVLSVELEIEAGKIKRALVDDMFCKRFEAEVVAERWNREQQIEAGENVRHLLVGRFVPPEGFEYNLLMVYLDEEFNLVKFGYANEDELLPRGRSLQKMSWGNGLEGRTLSLN